MVRAVLILGVSVTALFAADPWKDKKASDWNEKDAQRVLTNSPWAKTVTPEMDFSRREGRPGGGGGMRRGGGMGMPGGGMGGPGGDLGGPGGSPGGGLGGPGGGMGGPGGGMGGPGGGMELPKITVRWESAAPVREAAVRAEDPQDARIAEWAQEYYVISVSGMRPMAGGRRGPGGPAAGDRPQPDLERMKQMQERMLQGTSLSVKGKSSIPAAQVEMLRSPSGMRTVYLFPRSQSLTAEDKEVTFETTTGPMNVKTKFSFKDMQYQGKLAL